MPKYYPINEEAARRAKNANSFSDYVPGSATAAYRRIAAVSIFAFFHSTHDLHQLKKA